MSGRDARDAWTARDALIVEYTALRGWVDRDPLLLTTGIRDAYRCGLGVAVPVAEGTLGWAMDEGGER